MTVKTGDRVKRYPEVVVGLFVFNKKGEVLLAKSRKWRNSWVPIGGHVELGETIEHAAKREALEETGLRVKNVRLFNVLEGIFPKNFVEKKHFIYLHASCESTGKVRLDEDELYEYAWVPLKKAVGMRVRPNTRNSLLKLSEERRK
ncbi:MAG TPA: NUDIX domain-containing protein [Candidatus Norongarragalinales archaeon]|nr:NUDIX domain-containing protein [Candidatus Norongarragalinales archaeon]